MTGVRFLATAPNAFFSILGAVVWNHGGGSCYQGRYDSFPALVAPEKITAFLSVSHAHNMKISRRGVAVAA